MYPVWLINMFENNPCTNCRNGITINDIDAIGAGRPAPFEAHLREPLALIIATCPRCGQVIHFTTRCPKQSLMDAVRELAEQIETAPPGETPLFGKGAAPPQPAAPSVDADRDSKSPVRPSIRAGQKLGPPTDAEIKEFLARLKRMSFKSGSKSFNRLTGSDHRNDAGDQPDSDSPKE